MGNQNSQKTYNQKIVVCVNILTQVDPCIYNSHNQLWYRIGKHFPNAKLFQYTPERTTIDNARNMAAKLALEQECEYLLFIDDDMILHEMTFQSLMENIQRPEVDICMALTYIRGYPFHPMHFICRDKKSKVIESLDYYDDFEKDVDPKTYLLKVDAIGCACVMIKCELLKKMEAPFFLTSPAHTEDIYLCMKAKKLLGRDNVGVYVDCAVPTGHLMDKIAVNHKNVEALRHFYEELDPKLKLARNLKPGESAKNPDRGTEYLQKISENLPELELVEKK